MLRTLLPSTSYWWRLIPSLLLPIAVMPNAAWGEPSTIALTGYDLAAARGDWQTLAAGCESPWLAYYDLSGQGQLRNPDGQRQALASVNSKAANKSSGLELLSLEPGVAVVWRDKFPEKQLLLRRADLPEAEVLSLAGDSQPLPRIASHRQGHLLQMVWLGEKPLAEAATPYHLYHRTLNLSDGSLSDLELVMPGIYPMTAMDSDGNLMVASWSENGENSRIVARYRSAATQAFGPPALVAEVTTISSLYHAFTNNGRWFLFWVRMDGVSAQELRLEGAYSDDAGNSWKSFTVEGLGGIDVSSLDMIKNDEGVILMAVSGRYREAPDTDKHKVFLIRSEDNGTSWSLAPPLQSPVAINRFMAKNPKLTFGANRGEVLVAWQDWREIRSRLYASFSTDYGKTWAIDNLPLPHAPLVNQLLDDAGHDLWLDPCGTFHLVSEQAENDLLKRVSLVEQKFTTQDLRDWAGAPRLAPGSVAPQAKDGTAPDTASTLEAGVRERVTAFWTAMIANDYPKAYEFYDPFYRASIKSLEFQLRMGKVKYEKFEIGKIQIDGTVANVEVKVTAMVPEFRVPSTGEMVSRPAKEITLNDKWLWVDDGWYREFFLSSIEGRWTKY